MLVKMIVILASAIIAGATSDAEAPPKPLPPGIPVCAECQPCAVDCLCPVNFNSSSCAVKPPHGPHPHPHDPAGRPVCAENQPCKSGCICAVALRPPKDFAPIGSEPAGGVHIPGRPEGRIVCAEGQPCSPECLCSLANLLGFLNPDKLRPQTLICDVGKSNETCIGRENLLESLKDVLFPPEGTTQIDFGGAGGSAKGRDEL